MKNFVRVLRLSLRYRMKIVLAMASALGVAVLWGGNIGAIYPFVEIASKGDSLQTWVRDKITESRSAADEKKSEIERLTAELVTAPLDRQASLRAKIHLAESRVAAEEEAVDGYLRLKPYIDDYLPNDPFATLALVTGLLLLGTAVKDLFLIANNIVVAQLANLATFRMRTLFYRRTLRMDLATFDEDGTADLMSRFTNDAEAVTYGLTMFFGKMVREPLKMIACLVGAAFVCWRLLLLSLVVAPVAALLIRWLAKTLKRANRQAMEGMAEIYAVLEESFRAIKIVKAFTNERYERRRFHRRSKLYYFKAMRIARYNSLSQPISEMMGIMTISLALMAGVWLALSGETHLLGIRMSARPLDLGSLLLFYAMLVGTADPARKLSSIFVSIQQAAAATDRIYERLDREPRIRNPRNPVTLQRHRGDLVFEGVGFAYRPDQPVLEGIDLRIPFGQTFALVGHNGCGKSSLANLIPRFYDPTVGTIRLDGNSLKDLRLRDLRSQISLVTQETVLFDDTIFNNIRYGATHATPEEVVAAAKQAHAHRFIENELPDGYETVVGAMGNRLSGGQRQRIALARAILRDPSILILDEATSQVDLESERAIQHVLERFIQNRTVLIITHRTSVLALADRIVMMQSGRILDMGTHDELLARCAPYRRLIQIDNASQGPEPTVAA